MAIIHATSEPRGVLLLTFNGEVVSEHDAKVLKEDIDMVASKIRSLHRAQNHGIKVLINITNFTAEYVTEAVEAMIHLAKEDKNLVEKTAVFGASLKLRVIGDAIVKLSGRDNIKFFEDKTLALHWLDEK